MNDFKTRFFKHYKNKPYRYLGVVRHSETLEEMALYETLYKNDLGTLWVRPKQMFFENVTINQIVQPRFKHVEFKFKSVEKLSESVVIEMAELQALCFANSFNQKKFLSKLKAQPHQYHILAYEENKLIGYKLGYALDDERFYSWQGAVHTDYKGLGVATELLLQQHTWCLQQKFKYIETRTRNEFRKMISLNLAHGFKIVGTILDANQEIKILLEKKLV